MGHTSCAILHAMAVLRLAAAAILSLIIGVDGKTDKARTLIMKGRIPRESSDSGTPKDIKIRSLHSKHYSVFQLSSYFNFFTLSSFLAKGRLSLSTKIL